MSKNYIVINGKRAELTEEQIKQLGIEPKRSKRWRANCGDEYWFVNCGWMKPMRDTDLRGEASDYKYYSHNYFQTREEAETYARVLKTEMLLKKYADEHNEKFKDYKYTPYITIYNILQPDACCAEAKHGRGVWFSSKEIVQNAIKEIGEDRIREYLTYEW